MSINKKPVFFSDVVTYRKDFYAIGRQHSKACYELNNSAAFAFPTFIRHRELALLPSPLRRVGLFLSVAVIEKRPPVSRWPSFCVLKSLLNTSINNKVFFLLQVMAFEN